jgi:hypothetical protein
MVPNAPGWMEGGGGGGLTRSRLSLSAAQLPLNAAWAIGLESAAPLRTDPDGVSLSNVMLLDCTGLPSALASTS